MPIILHAYRSLSIQPPPLHTHSSHLHLHLPPQLYLHPSPSITPPISQHTTQKIQSLIPHPRPRYSPHPPISGSLRKRAETGP
ncbi:hypothetical protein P154DRAFT_232422 [Amniculicola lignicola CBS 123094]|uniref:Uncharacterized protein n=1 Tax=Amniculicola lignicola CBS 123094 TaxID=1392246 RepID=A0A6A5WEM5_9PLEO|nr:hypothetical protein P154DRAFT_232422 [Amniculicola lignicola CBS 123094]